ncbi:MAG: prepilin-type N-terminal cleavage/methylation domain-containing protein [Myxococcota bacterium]
MDTQRRRAARGFTLIELVIALAASLTILEVSSHLIVQMTTDIKAVESRASADVDAKLLVDFLVRTVQPVGGGNVRPWYAVWIEDDCAPRAGLPDCQDSDRLTVLTLDSSFVAPECGVTAGGVNGPLTTTAGCLVAGMVNKHAVLTNSAGQHRSVVITAINSPGADQATFVTGQAAGLDQLPGSWAGATLTMVTVATYYWDSATHELKRWVDADADNTADAAEITVLADRVHDLQFAYGFDMINPADGRVSDTNSGTDEWQFNSTSDTLSSGLLQVGTDIAARSDLRLVAVGIMVGAPSPKLESTASLLNGPLRSVQNVHLRAARSLAYTRNLFIFN